MPQVNMWPQGFWPILQWPNYEWPYYMYSSGIIYSTGVAIKINLINQIPFSEYSSTLFPFLP